MKTIQLIAKTVANMKEIGIPADITIGTFKLASNGSLYNWAGKCGEYRTSIVTFELQFKPSHIQTLKNMGVKIVYDTAVMAGLSDKALRFKSGREAIKQGDYAPYYYKGNPGNNQTGVAIESQYNNIKAIRRTAQGKAKSSLLPIQKRTLNLK